MEFDAPLVAGTLLGRRQRFLADVRLPDGATVTAHCPNPGSMRTCLGDGWPVRLSPAANPRRRLRWTLEMVHNGRCWIGVHPLRANRLAEEAVRCGRVPALCGFTTIRREIRYGRSSRIDLLLEAAGGRCFVEVKSVTLLDGGGRNAFPDAVTVRGRRHLAELEGVVAAGDRAAMLFVIQRSDGTGFTAADDIDPAYGAALRRARAAGVELLAVRADVSPDRIDVVEEVPILL